MEVSGQHHAPVALPPGKYSGTTRVGSRVGIKDVLGVLEKTKIKPSLPAGFVPRTLQPATYSLYQLRDPGSHWENNTGYFYNIFKNL
jgi:hypothetical protein